MVQFIVVGAGGAEVVYALGERRGGSDSERVRVEV